LETRKAGAAHGTGETLNTRGEETAAKFPESEANCLRFRANVLANCRESERVAMLTRSNELLLVNKSTVKSSRVVRDCRRTNDHSFTANLHRVRSCRSSQQDSPRRSRHVSQSLRVLSSARVPHSNDPNAGLRWLCRPS